MHAGPLVACAKKTRGSGEGAPSRCGGRAHCQPHRWLFAIDAEARIANLDRAARHCDSSAVQVRRSIFRRSSQGMHNTRLRSDQHQRPIRFPGSSSTDVRGGGQVFRRNWRRGEGRQVSGNVAIPERFNYAGDFERDLARVSQGGKYFFRIAHSFIEGVASVQLSDSGKWGYIDKTGGFAVPPIYDSAMPFCAGVA